MAECIGLEPRPGFVDGACSGGFARYRSLNRPANRCMSFGQIAWPELVTGVLDSAIANLPSPFFRRSNRCLSDLSNNGVLLIGEVSVRFHACECFQ